MPHWHTPFEQLAIGKGRLVKEGKSIAVLSLGHVGNFALAACEKLEKEGISAAHYDLRFAKPLDRTLLHDIFGRFDKVITVEDGCIQGGFGSAVLEFAADNGYKADIRRLGIPDEVIEHGEQPELHHLCGYDQEAIEKHIFALVGLPQSIPDL